MQRVKFFAGLIIGIGLTVFALQNIQSTAVHLLLWSFDLPLVAIIFTSAGVGALWASLWMAMARWRKRRSAATQGSAVDVNELPPPTQ